jgi:hypothetical protein
VGSFANPAVPLLPLEESVLEGVGHAPRLAPEPWDLMTND